MAAARDDAGERQEALPGRADDERLALSARDAFGERRLGNARLEAGEAAGVQLAAQTSSLLCE